MKKTGRNLKRVLSGLLTLALVASSVMETGVTGYAASYEETELSVLDAASETTATGSEAAVSGNEAAVSGNEPTVSGNEAAVSGNEAAVSGNEPAVSGNEATVSGNEPTVSDNEPGVVLWSLGGYNELTDSNTSVECASYEDMLAGLDQFTPAGGYEVVCITYYPDRAETPVTEIPAEVFRKVGETGIRTIRIELSYDTPGAGGLDRASFVIDGLRNTESAGSMSLAYNCTTSGDSLLDEKFGAGHYVKFSYAGVLPDYEWGASFAGYREGILSGFGGSRMWQYTETAGELTQEFAVDIPEGRDWAEIVFAGPDDSDQPDSYVLAGGENIKFEGRIEIREGDDGDGRRILTIDPGSAGLECTEEWILEAIEANKGREPLDGVRLELANMKEKTVDKDIVNAILDAEILKEEHVVEFGFYNEGEQDQINLTLSGLKSATEDKKVDITRTLIPGVGMKVKSAVVGYPADWVDVWSFSDAEDAADKLESAFGGTNPELAICPLTSGTISGVQDDWAYYSEGDNGFGFGNLNRMKAGEEYLITAAQELESLTIGTEQTLGIEGVTGTVTWKSLSPQIASVNGSKVIGLSEGRAYITGTYQAEGSAVTKLFFVEIVRRANRIVFAKTAVNLELPRDGEDWTAEHWPRVIFYPSEAACDIGNPEEFRWTNSDPTVVAFIMDSEDETRCYGAVRALKAGTAVITGQLLDGEGNPVESVSASYTVTVTAPEDIPEEAFPDVYAVTNFDSKLEDVVLTDPSGQGQWKWKNGNTSLALYKDTDGHDFPAIYTTKNGKELEANVWLRMVSITGVEICGYDSGQKAYSDLPGAIGISESVTLGYRFSFEHADEEEQETISATAAEKYQAVWSAGPGGTQFTEEDIPGMRVCHFAADAGTGKKTFTLELKDKTTGKTAFKKTCTITVADKVIDWEKVGFDLNEEAGTLTISQPGDASYKLTVKSADTSVLKVGRVTVNGTDTVVSYTQQKAGTTYFVVTAADDLKSSRRYEIRFTDTEPKLGKQISTINPKSDSPYASFEIIPTTDCPELAMSGNNDQFVELSGKDAGRFKVLSEAEPDSDRAEGYFVSLGCNGEIPDGKYQLNLKVSVKTDGEPIPYELPVTITVKSQDPKVTFKQTGKVNLFYNDEEGYGELEISGTDSTDLSSITLEGCDYELTSDDRIKLKSGKTGANKKGYFSYSVDGYNGTFTSKAFTVSVSSTKPALVLSQKSDTLYPAAGHMVSEVTVLDKATGEPVQLSEAQYVVDRRKQEYQSLSEELPVEVATRNNTYSLNAIVGDGLLRFALDTKKTGKTDKFEIRVKADNWTDYLTVSYSIKAEAAPKLALRTSTVTLNRSDAVYLGQQAVSALTFKGSSQAIASEQIDSCRILGKDEKSTREFKVEGSLALEYRYDTGEVVARFNDNDIAKGTYKYEIYLNLSDEAGNFELSTVLTVKVVDDPVSKCLKQKTSGSIDLLNRDRTAVVVTPALKNLSGKVVFAYLEGDDDSNLFDAEYNEKGQLEIRAGGTSYSTKVTYVVTPVYEVENSDGERYRVTGTPLKLKLKQGKAKVTASSNGGSNVLYRTGDNSICISLKALLNRQEVRIDDVELLNYQDDLEFVPQYLDENEEPVFFDSDRGILMLRKNGNDEEITKAGSYTVKLAVYLEGRAGNEKPILVTYKIAVK